MRERPILFSAPMVRALLDGSKMQTRRIVKSQPIEEDGSIYSGRIFGPEMYEPVAYDKHGEMVPGPEIFGIYTEDGEWGVKCPYGQPGDHLWVRETWLRPGLEPVIYKADKWSADLVDKCKSNSAFPQLKWKPSIHMPRWASRILLEITDVRVERLQDCSEADALAVGVTFETTHPRHQERMARDAYRKLWESINGDGSWNFNPWVWVVEFRMVKP